VPTKLMLIPSLSAIARSSSLSKPVNWPAELMQMLGGASESVPTVSVPGTLRHWSTAAAGAASPTLPISKASKTTTDVLTAVIQAR